MLAAEGGCGADTLANDCAGPQDAGGREGDVAGADRAAGHHEVGDVGRVAGPQRDAIRHYRRVLPCGLRVGLAAGQDSRGLMDVDVPATEGD